MARFLTANQIINRVSVEVGLGKQAAPYSSTDEAIIQLQELLNIAGEELVSMHDWEILRAEEAFTTGAEDSGEYDLPDDFSHMIDQTGWERSENVPLFGPLSAQDWAYLKGRDLVSFTIYASFRIMEGKFNLFPLPPAPNLDIAYEYVSRNWVLDADMTTTKSEMVTGADVARYEPMIITRYLKLKFLEAKGFDTTKAQDDFNAIFNQWTGKDKGAEILNAGRGGRIYPYLDTYLNTPDTNFGRQIP